jgi:hypothetical protein
MGADAQKVGVGKAAVSGDDIVIFPDGHQEPVETRRTEEDAGHFLTSQLLISPILPHPKPKENRLDINSSLNLQKSRPQMNRSLSSRQMKKQKYFVPGSQKWDPGFLLGSFQ